MDGHPWDEWITLALILILATALAVSRLWPLPEGVYLDRPVPPPSSIE